MYQSLPQEDFLTEEPIFRLARKTKRWIAAAIDYIIFAIIMGVIVYCFGEPVTDAEGNTTYSITGGLGTITFFAVWFVCLPLVEMLNNGQTIGKMIFKIRAANMAGAKLEYSAAIARHLFDLVDYFPFFGIVGLLVASNNSQQQRVGDLVAKTIVIEA